MTLSFLSDWQFDDLLCRIDEKDMELDVALWKDRQTYCRFEGDGFPLIIPDETSLRRKHLRDGMASARIILFSVVQMYGLELDEKKHAPEITAFLLERWDRWMKQPWLGGNAKADEPIRNSEAMIAVQTCFRQRDQKRQQESAAKEKIQKEQLAIIRRTTRRTLVVGIAIGIVTGAATAFFTVWLQRFGGAKP